MSTAERPHPQPAQPLDERIALLAILALLLGLVTTPVDQPRVLGLQSLAVLALLLATRIPLQALAQRLLIISPLLLGILLAAPAMDGPGSPLLELGPVELHRQPLERVLVAMVKSVGAVALVTVLAERIPFDRLLFALRGIGVPEAATLQIGLTWRYVSLLVGEARSMRRALRMRGYQPGWAGAVGATGQLVGNLFVRTLDRAHRVRLAMLARGAEQGLSAQRATPLPKGQLLLLALAALLLVATRFLR